MILNTRKQSHILSIFSYNLIQYKMIDLFHYKIEPQKYNCSKTCRATIHTYVHIQTASHNTTIKAIWKGRDGYFLFFVYDIGTIFFFFFQILFIPII